MECRYCGTYNSDHDHRCARCGRRLGAPLGSAIGPIPINSKLATAQAIEPMAPPEELAPPDPSQLKQGLLFTPQREPVRVVEFPSQGRKKTSSNTSTSRLENQQKLAFPNAMPHGISTDYSIYCDAPVSLPPQRIMAAAIDGSMVLISLGLFLGVFHLAGAQVVLNKATMPLYALAAFVTLTVYRLLWVFANTDSFGTRWSGVRLITFDGAIPERQQRLHRLVTSYISTIAGGIGVFWGLVDEEKLTWYDHMSKTFPTPAAPRLKYPKRH